MRKIHPKHLIELYVKRIISKGEFSVFIRDEEQKFKLSSRLYFPQESESFEEDNFVLKLHELKLINDNELRHFFWFKSEKPKDIQKEVERTEKLKNAVNSVNLETVLV